MGRWLSEFQPFTVQKPASIAVGAAYFRVPRMKYETTCLGPGRYRCEGEGIARIGSSKPDAYERWLRTLVETQTMAIRAQAAIVLAHPSAVRHFDVPGHTVAKMAFAVARAQAHQPPMMTLSSKAAFSAIDR